MKPYIKDYASWCYTAPTDDAATVRNMNNFMIPSLNKELKQWQDIGIEAFGDQASIYKEAVELLTEALDVWCERLKNNACKANQSE